MAQECVLVCQVILVFDPYHNFAPQAE